MVNLTPVDLYWHRNAPEVRVGLIALQRIRDEQARIFGRPVDLLTKNGVNRQIRDDILRNAQIIHAE